jgi:hypothetical protein|tara:strand:- start:1110 stop:1349 length:240 start_codon:yes stop_codon:yes gene_type:complete
MRNKIMIPTNTLDELTKAEFDLQRSQVSLIREMGKGNEKSRLHANTLQAMTSALVFVQDLIINHADTKKAKVELKKKVK